jgi:hypothetical protein
MPVPPQKPKRDTTAVELRDQKRENAKRFADLEQILSDLLHAVRLLGPTGALDKTLQADERLLQNRLPKPKPVKR